MLTNSIEQAATSGARLSPWCHSGSWGWFLASPCGVGAGTLARPDKQCYCWSHLRVNLKIKPCTWLRIVIWNWHHTWHLCVLVDHGTGILLLVHHKPAVQLFLVSAVSSTHYSQDPLTQTVSHKNSCTSTSPLLHHTIYPRTLTYFHKTTDMSTSTWCPFTELLLAPAQKRLSRGWKSLCHRGQEGAITPNTPGLQVFLCSGARCCGSLDSGGSCLPHIH